MATIPVHLRVVVGYTPPTQQAFIEGQANAVKSEYRQAFENITISPQSVILKHATRSAVIQSTTATITAAGDFEEGPTLRVAFETFRLLGIQQIRFFAPTVYFATEVSGVDLQGLLAEHVRALANPHFRTDLLGQIVDTAAVYRFRPPGAEQVTNCQFGPMGRDQWALFGGPEARAIEGSLPAVAWGIGFFFQPPVPPIIDILRYRI